MKTTDIILIAILCFCIYAAARPEDAAELLDKAQAKISTMIHN